MSEHGGTTGADQERESRREDDRFLVVVLAGSEYGIPFRLVREIRSYPARDRAESAVLGRPEDGPTAVVDLRVRLGGPAASASGGDAIVLSGPRRCALVVDRAIELVSVPERRITTAVPEESGPPLVRGRATTPRPLAILDADALLDLCGGA